MSLPTPRPALGPQPVWPRHTPWPAEPWPLHRHASASAIEAAAAAALPPHTLMQRAGLGVARLALALAPHAARCWIVAGPGNNGGDGFEAALHLAAAGRAVRISWLGTPERLPADAARSLARAQAAGIAISTTLEPPPGWSGADLLIDALLGRGLGRPVTGALAEAIHVINQQPAPVLAVDLPSGLPGDTGQPADTTACVQARWTLALLSLAPGLCTAQGRDLAGAIWWDDLGIDTRQPEPAAWLCNPAALAPHWPARRHAQHKGSFGDVRVVGGAASMHGAALLAGRAALHAGAGRIYLQPLDAALAGDALHPELMCAALPAGAAAAAAPPADWLAALRRSTVVAGCGGGDTIAAWLPALLSQAGRLLLDADALNALARSPALQATLRQRHGHGLVTVLTPHPLEAARLLGCSTAEVQADRLAAAQQLAEQLQSVLLLKGSGSVLAAPGQTPWINLSGNAALATPGSGDVLAGWLGGLWSQLPWPQTPDSAGETAAAWLAARSAAWSHGRTAEHISPQGLACPAALLAERLRGQPPVDPAEG